MTKATVEWAKPALAQISIGDLAKELGAVLHAPKQGDDSRAEAILLTGVAPLGSAQAGQLSFLANPEYAKLLPSTKASAVIVAKESAECDAVQLIHSNPYWAFAKSSQFFFKPESFAPGVSVQAYVAPTARVGKDVTILPNAFVAEDAHIGDGVVLYPGVYVGKGAQIGSGTVIRANAVIEHGVIIGRRGLIHGGAVIGADGFGFAPGEKSIAKIPQIGRVVIGDDVEVGGLSTIDRGAMADTIIGDGTKIDSHVHVGHNVVIGKNCMLCAFSGIAGSAKLGDWVTLAGHAAVNNHVVIASRVTVGAMSGLTKSAPVSGVYMGFPAQPASEWRRQTARVRRLQELEERVKKLEALLAAKA